MKLMDDRGWLVWCLLLLLVGLVVWSLAGAQEAQSSRFVRLNLGEEGSDFKSLAT